MLIRYFYSKKTCENRIKIIRSSILLVLVLLTPIVVLAQNSEEVITENTDTVVNNIEVNNIEVIDNNEEIIDIGKGMEIMPNLEGSSFETNDQKDPKIRSLMNTLAPQNEEIEDTSYVPGGLYWGHFTGSSGSTIDIWKEYTDSKVYTYIEPTSNSSGVVPILGQQGEYYKIAISGITGWVDKRYVKVVPFNPAGHYNYYRRNTEGDLIHYVNTVGGANSYAAINQGEAPSYFVGQAYYMSFDGQYFYQPTEAGFRNMIDNYNAGTRTNSINRNDPYINYFQWLPARTQSTLTIADMDKYLTNNGKDNNTQMRSRLFETSQLFVNNGNLYGSNHGLAFASAIHESAWGRSGMAKNRNNFFGHAAYDSSPSSANVYDSADIGIANHFARFLNWNYLDTNPRYSTYNGGSVGNKNVGMNVKYASDPYWGEKIAAHYYNMDKLAGKKDYRRYTLAQVNRTGAPVYKEARSNSGSPYNVRHSGITVAILDSIKEGSNTWHQFTSDPILDSNKNPLAWKSDLSRIWTKVNYAKSDLYINSKDVTVVSQGKNSKLLPQSNPTSKTPPSFDSKKTVIYALDGAQLRPDWSNDYSVIMSFLNNLVSKNTRLEGYKTSNGWYQIQISESNTMGYIGYIHESKLSLSPGGPPITGGGVTPPVEKWKYTVTAELGLRLRSKPSTASDSIVLDTIPFNTVVEGERSVNGWTKVEYDGKIGYVSSEFLKEVGEIFHKYDLTKDKRIDIRDMMLIRQYILGTIDKTPERTKDFDLNLDKTIDIRDMMIIRIYILNN